MKYVDWGKFVTRYKIGSRRGLVIAILLSAVIVTFTQILVGNELGTVQYATRQSTRMVRLTETVTKFSTLTWTDPFMEPLAYYDYYTPVATFTTNITRVDYVGAGDDAYETTVTMVKVYLSAGTPFVSRRAPPRVMTIPLILREEQTHSTLTVLKETSPFTPGTLQYSLALFLVVVLLSGVVIRRKKGQS